MQVTDRFEVFDATIELTDDYTGFVTRARADALVKWLRSKLSAIPIGTCLVLDFASVTSIDSSFVDELLVPLLQEIQEGKYEGRFIAGVNFDSTKLNVEMVSKHLRDTGTLFVALDKSKRPIWFGLEDASEQSVLSHVYSSQEETIDHLQVTSKLPQSELEPILERLRTARLVASAVSPVAQGQTIVPTVALEEFLIPASDSVFAEFKTSIQAAVEKGCHYDMGHGIHATEYLHVARAFADARLAARAAMLMGEHYNRTPPQAVLTVNTPPSLAFAQRLAEYHGAKFLAADVDEDNVASLLPGLELPSEALLIAIDVVASGTDITALLNLARPLASEIIGICAVVDTTPGETGALFKVDCLVRLPLQQYPSSTCPLCVRGVPLTSVLKLSPTLHR